jgi:hypothetical protein
LIADGTGRFDVFTIASADPLTRRVTADRAFAPPYAAGSIIVETNVDTFQLEAQPDGTRTLVRVTGAGSVQPMIDRVDELGFEVSTIDEVTGALTPMSISALSDGPWLRGSPGGMYDEDVFRIRHVAITLTLRGFEPSPARRSIRFGVALRNAR